MELVFQDKVGQVVCFTTIKGEIIGKLTHCGATHIVIDHPMVLTPEQTRDGFVLKLYPHSLTDPEGSHVFNHAAIVSSNSASTPDALEKHYLSVTSGILLSSALDQMERG